MPAHTNPMNTSGTYLLYSSTETGTFEKLVDVKSVPKLGSAPSKLEITDLTMTRKGYIQGLQDSDDMEFTCNYTKANYDKCAKLDGSTLQYFKVMFGDEEGTDGITCIKGYPYCFKNGAEADAVREFTFGITVEYIGDDKF